jgi:HSP20 family protein
MIPAFHSNYLDRMLCNALYAEFSYILEIRYACMTTSEKSEASERKEEETNLPRRADAFDTFRRNIEKNIERAFTRPWPSTLDWRFPSMPFGALVDVRAPLCDMVDRGDRYELQIEVPGIEKEKIDLKATKHAIEISGEQSEKTEEKGRNYVYNERSYRSFQRRVPIPEEIVPSKVNAKMVNGVLTIELPKKVPTKVEEETTKVKVG